MPECRACHLRPQTSLSTGLCERCTRDAEDVRQYTIGIVIKRVERRPTRGGRRTWFRAGAHRIEQYQCVEEGEGFGFTRFDAAREAFIDLFGKIK